MILDQFLYSPQAQAGFAQRSANEGMEVAPCKRAISMSTPKTFIEAKLSA
jgi:hypothetical protein